jgi:PAS domain S-box-containing protein
MFEIPQISPYLLRAVIQNFTIIATLILLYNFVPETLLNRSRLVHALSVGGIFGLAAVLSIPLLWENAETATLGFNIILVPLAGFIGGPVSTVFVAVVLLAGSIVSGGSVSAQEIVTVTGGVFAGAVFHYFRRFPGFPRSYVVQYLLLGTGVFLAELSGFLITLLQTPTPSQAPAGLPAIFDIIPFFLASIAGTMILGGIITFIDRRKQAEREVREQKGQLEVEVAERTADLRKAISLQNAAFEATADAIIVFDSTGEIRAYNRKALRFLGVDTAQKQDFSIVTFKQAANDLLLNPYEVFRMIDAPPESAGRVVAQDISFKDGRICELFVQPQRLGDQVVGRVFSFHDITDQRRAEEAIRAANNKLILLSDINRHDILNQMTIVSGYLELFKDKEWDSVDRGRLEIMRKSLEVMRLQTEFTRDYQDLGLQKPVWVNIQDSFGKALESFTSKASFHCSTGTLEIFCDPLIERVFYNLIDNSLRHGERTTEVRLTSETAGPDLLLVYEDNGVGVPPEEKEKIFDKGFGKHTGLGMFLIREILSITGMQIRETGVFGHGVRFEIRIPAGRFRFTS